MNNFQIDKGKIPSRASHDLQWAIYIRSLRGLLPHLAQIAVCFSSPVTAFNVNGPRQQVC